MLKTVLKNVILILCIGIISFGISILPVVPALKKAQSIVMFVVMAFAMLVVISGLVRLFKRRNKGKCGILVLVAGMSGGIFCIAFSIVLFGAIRLAPFVSGTELMKTVPIKATGGTIYIYEKGGVPDGFESTTIAYSPKWQPFEKKLYTSAQIFSEVIVDKQFVFVRYIDGNEKKFSIDSLRMMNIFKASS